jgi:predicted dehydrogenase
VWIHDARLEAAQRLAAEVGGEATDKLEDAFSQPIDGLIIATPPPIRLDPISLACRHGVHLFVEKPPAYNLEQGRQCLQEIEKAGVMAAVGFNLRYDARYTRLRELIDNEPVHLVRTVCTIDYYLNFGMSPWFLQKSISGGPIAEQAIHLLDCVRFLFGNARATRALACGSKNMALDRPEFDAESIMQIVYELDNGVLATHMNHCGHDRFHFDLEVVGPHLRLHANVTEPNIRGYNRDQIMDIPVAENAAQDGRLQVWLQAIRSGDASLIRSPFADALCTQALVDAAIRSQSSESFEQVEQV